MRGDIYAASMEARDNSGESAYADPGIYCHAEFTHVDGSTSHATWVRPNMQGVLDQVKRLVHANPKLSAFSFNYEGKDRV